MKFIISIILGLITTGASYFFAVKEIHGFAADEIYRGFPYKFYREYTWAAFPADGTSNPFSIVPLVIDIAFWTIIWLFVVIIISTVVDKLKTSKKVDQ